MNKDAEIFGEDGLLVACEDLFRPFFGIEPDNGTIYADFVHTIVPKVNPKEFKYSHLADMALTMNQWVQVHIVEVIREREILEE